MPTDVCCRSSSRILRMTLARELTKIFTSSSATRFLSQYRHGSHYSAHSQKRENGTTATDDGYRHPAAPRLTNVAPFNATAPVTRARDTVQHFR